MLHHELENSLLVLLIIAGPFLLAWQTRSHLWPSVTALFYTISAVVASAFIWSPGYDYGGFLLVTIPFSPLIFLYGWVAAKVTNAAARRRAAYNKTVGERVQAIDG